MGNQDGTRTERAGVQGKTEQNKPPNIGIQKDKWDMMETFKIRNNYYDESVSNFLRWHIDLDILPNANKTCSHRKMLFKRRPTLEVSKNSFSFRIVHPRNSLPQEIVAAHSIKSFKRHLVKFRASHYIKFNYKICLIILHRNMWHHMIFLKKMPKKNKNK